MKNIFNYLLLLSAIFILAISFSQTNKSVTPAAVETPKPPEPAKVKESPKEETILQMPNIFSDNMVLQRDMPINIWGKTNAGNKLTVTLEKIKGEAIADKAGKWTVKLPQQQAGGPFTLIIECKDKKIEYKNVMIGEVWLCSGQSNMFWGIEFALNSKKEIAEAKYPDIRLYTVSNNPSITPLENCEGKWKECSPENIKKFSAVAYFFGRELYKNLNVPIGIINSSVGGTPVEAWMSKEALTANPNGKPIYERWEEFIRDYPAAMEKYKPILAEWEKKYKEIGDKAGDKPIPPYGETNRRRPNVLFNSMINPIIPYTMRGATWYQGESNATRALQYASLFPDMIKDWRTRWGLGDFPFIFTQIANFDIKSEVPTSWAELREAQRKTLSVPNTGMAVAADIGEPKNLHPPNKQEAGRRLALVSFAKVYKTKNEDECISPNYKSMSMEDNKIRLIFDHTGGELKTNDGKPPREFLIAGPDQKFVEAKAEIDKDTIVVWSEEIHSPAAVRYGWKECPMLNLYNKYNLPVMPFKTDGWKWATDGNLKP